VAQPRAQQIPRTSSSRWIGAGRSHSEVVFWSTNLIVLSTSDYPLRSYKSSWETLADSRASHWSRHGRFSRPPKRRRIAISEANETRKAVRNRISRRVLTKGRRRPLVNPEHENYGYKAVRVVGAAVGARFLTAAVFAQDSSGNSSQANVKCIAGDSCKGPSSCEGETHSCTGQDSCKGWG
jgi:hypothetical protein